MQNAQNAQNIANAIAQLLQNKSVTFAQVNYVTQVKTAAKYKHLRVTKHVSANVQLFANVQADVYANAVKRSAAKQAQNNAQDVQNFTSSSNYYKHTQCYSIVQHNVTQALYLYCIYNNAVSTYYINDVLATKQQVAALLTASAAAQMLNASDVVHNVTHNITHNVQVRTIALHNITSITACKQHVTF
jgi:hypothetical protein